MTTGPADGGPGAPAPGPHARANGSAPEGAAADPAPDPESDPGAGAERIEGPLPESIRARIVEYAAELVGQLPADELPAPLRRVARFERKRRARLAGPQLAAQLETDEGFRELLGARVRTAWPELAEGIAAGVVPPAADPVTVAAVAYYLRPPGWSELVGRIRAELERGAAAEEEAVRAERVAQLREQLAEAKADAREEARRFREELRGARGEIAELRHKLHEARLRAREAEARADRAAREADAERAGAHARVAAAEKEARKLQSRLTAAENQVEVARRAARSGRSVEDARLRVLLDVLSDATQGLRRELALPTGIDRPADLAAGTDARGGPFPVRTVPEDDPWLLDNLLALPQAHLLVDGYNVTKSGYPTLPLADQRARLLGGLSGLAAQTKAEITCVFDGAEVEGAHAMPGPRRVRLLFSAPGETADDLIVRLVQAEPEGRPVVVVSSDGEIVRAVRRAGARPVPSRLLLRRLDPG
ncbi:NYN domain-containing protein [Allonocardiopsis opalescens]|uniref:Putative RNA-binding protein with PIN domain n=1 Tax=Allonocardiopsis opalescens TaxID=1144618 RepID=A0A2T0PZQ3_9ACTN|nr:NYN domain-containing protein [Allonocardiopsis opalescens]PRX97031.1 putative RNA-binding protein with PIN domain [Allonocardiopsis opalescens]